MYNASQIAAILRAAGLGARASTEIANILGNHKQVLKAGPNLEQDTTPDSLKGVTPDARRHNLTNLDFRKGDPDHRPNKVDDSERSRTPQPDPAVKTTKAPQQTDAAYGLVDGDFTNVVAADGAVAVNLSVQGNGRAMMLDPPSNTIIGKTLRCEAGGGGGNQSLVRFFIDETGQEVVWKLQLQTTRIPIITGLQYYKGRGLGYTVQTASVFYDAMDKIDNKVVPTVSETVVTALDKNAGGTDLIATKVKADVWTTDPAEPDHFAFGGSGSKVRLGKTTADWLKGTAATIPIYAGAPLSESATGESVTAYNLIGKVLANQWVFVAQGDNNAYYLIEAEKMSATAVWGVEIIGTTVAGVTTSKLVFHRRTFLVQAAEDTTDVEIPLTECVTPYSGSSGGGGYGGY